MPTDVFKTLEVISESHCYNLWIYNNIKNYIIGDVFDIGSGIGDIIQHYAQGSVRQIVASDYHKEMTDRLQSRFLNNNKYRIVQINIEQQGSHGMVKPETMDTITCINVLEHIENDVQALSNMNAFLKKNGTLILLVPALQSIYGTLDELVGHYRRYNKNNTRIKMEKSGFSVRKQFYMNFPGIMTWFIAGRILRHRAFSKNACKSLDKIVPVLEKIESVFPPFIGQSLITVCSKV